MVEESKNNYCVGTVQEIADTIQKEEEIVESISDNVNNANLLPILKATEMNDYEAARIREAHNHTYRRPHDETGWQPEDNLL